MVITPKFFKRNIPEEVEGFIYFAIPYAEPLSLRMFIGEGKRYKIGPSRICVSLSTDEVQGLIDDLNKHLSQMKGK